MLIEFQGEVPDHLRPLFTMSLVGKIAEIDGLRYQLDAFNQDTKEFRARRVLPNNQPVFDTATENILFARIKHFVVCQ